MLAAQTYLTQFRDDSHTACTHGPQFTCLLHDALIRMALQVHNVNCCRLAFCLVEANGDTASAACKRIEGILEELVTFYCQFSSLHPKKADKFRWTKLDEDSASAAAHTPAPQDLWHKIAKACNFDEQQQVQICGLRQFLATNLGKVLSEREAISAQLASAIPSQGAVGSNGMMAMGHVQALQATEKLHKNLQQAQECLTQFQVAARQCMNPLQAALFCVQAYPWMPDIVALFACTAEQRERSTDGGNGVNMSD